MSDDPESTGREQATGRFEPGVSGNPKGRPKGSRHALGAAFLRDLQADWEKNGTETLEKAREESPVQFAKMVAGLLPKELLVRTAPEDEMTDDELADTLAALKGVAEQLRKGDSEAGEGAGKAPRLQ